MVPSSHRLTRCTASAPLTCSSSPGTAQGYLYVPSPIQNARNLAAVHMWSSATTTAAVPVSATGPRNSFKRAPHERFQPQYSSSSLPLRPMQTPALQIRLKFIWRRITRSWHARRVKQRVDPPRIRSCPLQPESGRMQGLLAQVPVQFSETRSRASRPLTCDFIKSGRQDLNLRLLDPQEQGSSLLSAHTARN